MNKKHTITPVAAAWLTQTLDPFHDFPKEPVGKPDSVAGRSVIYCVNEQVTLTAAVVSDLHVFTMPELCRVDFGAINLLRTSSVPRGAAGTLQYPTVQYTAGADTTQPFGLFNWSMVPSGVATINCPDLIAGGLPATPALGGVQGCTNYSKYCTGRSRVVSAAYEIRNTTAELYRGGSSTSYRMPQGDTTTPFWNFDVADGVTDGHHFGYVDVDVIHCPPRTLAEATNIPDSVVLSSEEGNYSVVPVHLDDAAIACEYRPLLIRTNDLPNERQSALISVYEPNQPVVFEGPITTEIVRCRRPARIDTVGSYHSGLAAGSTMTINTRVYIEVFPSTADVLFPLSSRTPGYCPLAEEALILSFQALPVTCPVLWNETTKWWRVVLKTLGMLAPIVGVVGGPEGAVLGGIVGGALTAFSEADYTKKRGTSHVPPHKPSNSPASNQADTVVNLVREPNKPRANKPYPTPMENTAKNRRHARATYKRPQQQRVLEDLRVGQLFSWPSAGK